VNEALTSGVGFHPNERQLGSSQREMLRMSSAKSGKQSVKDRLGTALPTFVPAPGVVLLAVDEPISRRKVA
jgi:hypothetical protein